MTEKYKILGQYIKDMSSETPDIETYLFVKDQITKYHSDDSRNQSDLIHDNDPFRCIDRYGNKYHQRIQYPVDGNGETHRNPTHIQWIDLCHEQPWNRANTNRKRENI